MTEDDFWTIVDDVNSRAGGDMDAKERLLRESLEALDAAGVKGFSDHMDRMMGSAYTWPLWAAAYIIQGGCSDDGFMDFRSSLVFTGRRVFEPAVASPDSLGDLDDDTLDTLYHEGMLYIASEVHEAKAGGSPERSVQMPPEPTGEPWDEDDEDGLAALCPALWKRFGD